MFKDSRGKGRAFNSFIVVSPQLLHSCNIPANTITSFGTFCAESGIPITCYISFIVNYFIFFTISHTIVKVMANLRGHFNSEELKV